jgi:4-hydroxy-tetrahydrodipicolinate reductase
MRIGVCGAGGRMGREVCLAIIEEPGLDLACVVDPVCAGRGLEELLPGLGVELVLEGSINKLNESGVEVMVDFSIAAAARENVPYALEHGIHCVVGTTGFDPDDLQEFDRIAVNKGVGCLIAPNFAIGAVLMMEFARRAGRFMQACEIIELHHDAKLDAPSGTARNTARLILEGRGEQGGSQLEEGPRGLNIGGINVHSVRLPGLVAHQEVIFGGLGQTLTLRHDSYDRTSFMPGVIMAIREVSALKGLVVGLDKVMDL